MIRLNRQSVPGIKVYGFTLEKAGRQGWMLRVFAHTLYLVIWRAGR